MRRASRMMALFLFCLSWWSAYPAPKGAKTAVSFDRALPEDISNENFPDRIDSFDFPNAGLLDLVKAIGKLTGINFIVDPALASKKISIIAPSPITVAEAYKAFLSALSVNGFTVVKSGAFWKIQAIEKAHKDNIEVYSGDYFPNTDQLITRIIKLKHINAKNFESSIRWLLSQDQKVSVLESSNSIILSDYGSVIERIMKIVYELDVPGSEETIKIIPVEHASSLDLAEILSDLLPVTGKSRVSRLSARARQRKGSAPILSPSAKGQESSPGNLKISKIISDERTNSLVVSANKEGMKRVSALIKKLDRPIDASRRGGVYVYHVLYGTAEEVYNTLMGIKSSKEGANPAARQRSGYPGLPGRLRGAGSSASSPLFDENVTIMADNNTNSLIIGAKNKYDYERVLAVLKKIDVPRDQVFIQAIIVEMKINKGDSQELNLAQTLASVFKKGDLDFLGVNWTEILGSSIGGFLSGAFSVASLKNAEFGPGLILGMPFSDLLKGGGENSLNTPIWSPEMRDEFAGMSQENKRHLMQEGIRQSADSLANQTLSSAYVPLIRLLKTSDKVNVLSTPQLTTLDNVTAFIEVGEKIGVGLSNTATAGALSQNSVEREDVTLRMEITPRINPKSGTVQMDIKQKFDERSSAGSAASEIAKRSVDIVKRNIETKMVLNDKETAVLGGLLTDKEFRSENKVPILGDIPILGWLFKGSRIEREKRNLLVFITPTIVKGEEHKEKTKEILGAKLEERLNFIKKYMRGEDPHGQLLEDLIPKAQSFFKKKKTKWPWQKDDDSEEDQKKAGEPKDKERPIAEPGLPPEETEYVEIEEFIEEEEELAPEDYHPALPPEDEAPEDLADEPAEEGGEDFTGARPAEEPGFIPIEPENINF